MASSKFNATSRESAASDLAPIGMASRPQSFQLLFLLLLLHELLLGVNSKQPLSGLLPAAVSFVTGYQ